MMHRWQNHFHYLLRYSPIEVDLELLKAQEMKGVQVRCSVLEGIGHLWDATHDQLVMGDSVAGNVFADMRGNLHALHVIIDFQNQVLIW